jgi:hypothetical protein
VRELAVQISGDLEMRSTLEVMKKMYKNQDYHTCVEIIRAMAKMPDPSLMGFLKLVLDKEDDVQLQIEATKAIENNGEEGVRTLVKLMKSEYKTQYCSDMYLTAGYLTKMGFIFAHIIFWPASSCSLLCFTVFYNCIAKYLRRTAI